MYDRHGRLLHLIMYPSTSHSNAIRSAGTMIVTITATPVHVLI